MRLETDAKSSRHRSSVNESGAGRPGGRAIRKEFSIARKEHCENTCDSGPWTGEQHCSHGCFGMLFEEDKCEGQVRGTKCPRWCFDHAQPCSNRGCSTRNALVSHPIASPRAHMAWRLWRSGAVTCNAVADWSRAGPNHWCTFHIFPSHQPRSTWNGGMTVAGCIITFGA